MSQLAFVAARESPRVFANSTDARMLGGDWLRIVSTAKQLHRNAWFPRTLENINVTYLPCPQPLSGNPESLRIFNDWAHDCGVRGHESLDDLYSQIISQQTINGDVLILFPEIKKKKTKIKSRLMVIDSTRVRTPSNFTGSKTPRGNDVIHGVEVDPDGCEVGYWVCGVKDGSYNTEEKSFQYFPCDDERTGRPIARLLRRVDSTTPSSTRGMPSLTWIVGILKDTFDLENATIQAAQIRAMLAVILSSDRPNDISQALKVTPLTDGNGGTELLSNLDSGSVVVAPSGLTPHVIDGGAGNIDLVALFRELLTHMTAAVNWPVTIFLGDYTQVSYSGFKAVWDKCDRYLKKWNKSNCHFLDDIYAWVVIEGMLAEGMIPTDDDLKCTWSPIIAPDPNPIDTEKANNVAIINGTKTRSGIVSANGKDYKTHLLQIQKDRELETEILGAPITSQLDQGGTSVQPNPNGAQPL